MRVDLWGGDETGFQDVGLLEGLPCKQGGWSNTGAEKDFYSGEVCSGCLDEAKKNVGETQTLHFFITKGFALFGSAPALGIQRSHDSYVCFTMFHPSSCQTFEA